MRSVGASAISAATAARRPSRISSSWLLKVTALEYESVCGICGIASSRGPVDPGRLAEMSATLVHRGPDSDGSFVEGGVGLSARRLSIIDLEGGDQPIANEDGTVHVVQNGEIYNHEELRRGMLPIAVWEGRGAGRLVLARGRFGIKPLLYRHSGGELAFASELRALPRGEIDLDALEAFLAFNSIPAPLTIFRDCRKLPAGPAPPPGDGG